MTVFHHTPGDAVTLDCAVLHGPFDRIAVADQMTGQLIEAHRQSAVTFLAHPSVAPMAGQLIALGDTGFLAVCFVAEYEGLLPPDI